MESFASKAKATVRGPKCIEAGLISLSALRAWLHTDLSKFKGKGVGYSITTYTAHSTLDWNERLMFIFPGSAKNSLDLLGFQHKGTTKLTRRHS